MKFRYYCLGALAVILLSTTVLTEPWSWRTKRQRLLTSAAIVGSTSKIQVWLFLGANLNGDGAVYTPPLIAAADYGQLGAVKYLLEKGADPNVTQKLGNTALLSACYEGHTEVVRLLLSYGADRNARSDDGNAVEIASRRHHQEVLDLLLTSTMKLSHH